MTFAIGYFILWLIVTLIFGRIYCSTVCPAGTYQDICARLRRIGRNRARHDYHYEPPMTRTRYISLAIVVLTVLLGLPLIISLVDPYSIYTRFCVNLLNPLLKATLGDRFIADGIPDVACAAELHLMGASLLGLIISLLSMGILAWLAARNGRTFCNSICPVGTTLGFISRNSIFHIDINTDKCIQCRNCEHVCKASCIDLIDHVVDSSRCVTCFNCITVCPNDAIRYTTERHQLAIPMMQKIPFAGAGSANAATPAITPCSEKNNVKTINHETIS